MEIATPTIARLDRGYVEVSGPDATAFLERMLSNEVTTLPEGELRPALLLTPKARIIAPLAVARLGADAFLLVTGARELAEPVAAHLTRMRLRDRAAIEVRNYHGYRVGDREVWREEELPGPFLDEEEADRLRIRAGIPRWGRELDDRVLPAEAGLDETHVSFTKGCYPGQEPVARLRHRGHANRALRRLAIDARQPPPYDAELRHGDRVVGRVTSAARDPDHGVIALGYVRIEVPEDADLRVEGFKARILV